MVHVHVLQSQSSHKMGIFMIPWILFLKVHIHKYGVLAYMYIQTCTYMYLQHYEDMNHKNVTFVKKSCHFDVKFVKKILSP